MPDAVRGRGTGAAPGLGGATPAGLYLASYGGGDALRLHPIALSLFLTNEGHGAHRPLWLDPGEVYAAAKEAHAQILAIPEDERVPQVPASAPGPEFTWTSQLLVCTLGRDVPASGTAVTCNLMAQGWLFGEEMRGGHQQKGISRWPLVGVLQGVGLAPPGGGGTDWHEPADAGFGGALVASDQHAHLVVERLELGDHEVELADWHVGGDTSRVAVSQSGGSGFVAVVDLDSGRALECLLVVAPAAAADILSGLAVSSEGE
eukprot:CAMPEP_0179148656 /NCGR_PEP_ID=MMETSP0796-20121207/71958_1 /TAXON_ID=73915 /ORGANISM="Pyrodinium bahamense, Strain pbaha01" /LENGTH=260 /DNA_ID=CAMNT_0020849405 /DNA_START=9 /DNA_END=788 /DNA_ORIENTATION=+